MKIRLEGGGKVGGILAEGFLEVKSFGEVQGVDVEVDVAAGEKGGELVGEEFGVTAGDEDISSLFGVEGADGFVPVIDVLDFVEEEVMDAAGEKVFFESDEVGFGADVGVGDGVEVNEGDLLLWGAAGNELVVNLLKEARFAGTADAGQDLDEGFVDVGQ